MRNFINYDKASGEGGKLYSTNGFQNHFQFIWIPFDIELYFEIL